MTGCYRLYGSFQHFFPPSVIRIVCSTEAVIRRGSIKKNETCKFTKNAYSSEVEIVSCLSLSPRLWKVSKSWLKSYLYEENHPIQVRCLTWWGLGRMVYFTFSKTNRLYENGLISPRWDLTSKQVKSHLGGMIFVHVNSFCRAFPPRQDCSVSLDSVCFCNYYVKKCNSSDKI